LAIFPTETPSSPQAVKLARSWPALDIGLVDEIARVARELGTRPEWLAAIINAESGFNPVAVNSSTGATGLLQFMPSTAEHLGTSTSELASMSAIEQMQWVRAYFWPYRGKLKTPQSVYLAVFYPAARHWHPDREFPPAVRSVNPFSTPREYTEWVAHRARGEHGLQPQYGRVGHNTREPVVPGGHFYWYEFERRGAIPASLAGNTEALVRNLLEPMRMELLPQHGLPVTSGYRSPAYNEKLRKSGRYKGVSKSSKHTIAAAADVEPRSSSGVTNRDLVTWLWMLRGHLPIQQAIVETHTGHAHVAHGDRPSGKGQFKIGPGKGLRPYVPNADDIARVRDIVRRNTGRGVGETASAWLGAWMGPAAGAASGGTGGGGGGILLLIPVAIGLSLMAARSHS